jgi:excinuclease ABC subunit B
VGELREVVGRGERALVTTLTKRMSEDLAEYLAGLDFKVKYLHSELDAIERVEILRDLRLGEIDVVVGINLLREGLDLPEVSLVAILDADKEGFLRSERSLTQTAGRAARNLNGKVIMYADNITGSMQRTLDETNRRRRKQLGYNEKHSIEPKQITRTTFSAFEQQRDRTGRGGIYADQAKADIAADPVVRYMGKEGLEKAIDRARKQMEKAAGELDFIEAARFRDEMYAYQELLKNQ